MPTFVQRDPRAAKAVVRVSFTASVAVILLALALVFSSVEIIKYGAMIGLGAACFLIEHALRGISGRANPFRAFLPVWSLVPFAIVCIIGTTHHLHTRDDALVETRKLARELELELEKKDPPQTPVVAQGTSGAEGPDADYYDQLHGSCTRQFASRPAKTISDVVQLLSDRGLGTADAERFRQIARTIATDLNATHDPRCVKIKADRDTWPSFMLALAMQGLFVLWIPCLLAVSIAKARQPVAREESLEVAASRDTRDSVILGERRSLFVPRLCFGILVLLGTNYVFAPFGLKTTYMMSIVDQHASAGQTSFTTWSTDFAASPVIVSGFLGFLLYALITATQRFAQDDFDDQGMFALLVRGLIVILLSLALSASPLPEVASRLFVFFAGMFPMRALEAIGARLNVALDPDFTAEKVAGFDDLASLEPVKAFALRTAGIRSTYDLAAMNIATVAARVRIDPVLLGRLVDRAILIDTIGPSVAKKLALLGIQTATDLAELADDVPVLVGRCFAGDKVDADPKDTIAKRTCERLRDDPRRIAASQWLTGGPVKNPNAVVAAMPVDPAAAGDFITVDLGAFGGQKIAFPLRLVSDVGTLVSSVFAKLASAKVPEYDYGRSWVLVKKGNREWVWHDCMRLQRWGIPCGDPSLLAEQGIRAASELVAVDLRREEKSRTQEGE